MAEEYQLLGVSPQLKHQRDDSPSSIHPLRLSSVAVGKPGKQKAVNAVDCTAVIVVLLCAAAAVLVIVPSIPIAASLRFTNQIIVVGLLLGIMQICQQRIAQRLSIVLEARSKRSTIHNFDGLLRWSFLTSHLAWTWRAFVLVSMVLPLVLSVLYKRFTNGTASTTYTTTLGIFQPGTVAGVSGIGSVTTFANKTNALLIASADDALVPTTSQYPKAYGSSVLLLSDGSAAALDEPQNVLEMQRALPAGSQLYFSADVRGTVSTYNSSVESHRTDDSFWNSVGGDEVETLIDGDPGCQFGFQTQSGRTTDNKNLAIMNRSDESYAFLGGFPGVIDNANTIHYDAFHNYTLLFNTLRHECHGAWRLTPSTFNLVTGSCSSQALPMPYQYFKNSALDMPNTFSPSLAEILGPFAPCRARNGSAWYKPTAAATLAAAYSARLATVLAGPVYSGANFTPPFKYNLTTKTAVYGGLPRENLTITVWDQSYQPTNIEMHLEVPTLRADWGLYVVVLVQPFITVIGFLTLMLLYNTPVSGGFGLVSILAGVDTRSLDVLKGAGFSGELSKKVSMGISVVQNSDAADGRSNAIQYTVGETGFRGRVKRGVVYG